MPLNIFRRLVSPPLIVASITVLVLSCSPKKAPERNLEYFRQNLKADMDIDEFKETFGETEKLEDSGRSVFKYHFVDSTEVWIGYTDKMSFACFVDSNHNLVEDLILVEDSPISAR